MTLTEILFILTGTCTILVFGWKLVYLLMMLAPKLFCPLSESFFTSMGKWAGEIHQQFDFISCIFVLSMHFYLDNR